MVVEMHLPNTCRGRRGCHWEFLNLCSNAHSTNSLSSWGFFANNAPYGRLFLSSRIICSAVFTSSRFGLSFIAHRKDCIQRFECPKFLLFRLGNFRKFKIFPSNDEADWFRRSLFRSNKIYYNFQFQLLQRFGTWKSLCVRNNFVVGSFTNGEFETFQILFVASLKV